MALLQVSAGVAVKVKYGFRAKIHGQLEVARLFRNKPCSPNRNPPRTRIRLFSMAGEPDLVRIANLARDSFI